MNEDPSYEVKGSTLTIYKSCTAIFGAENVDTTNFQKSDKNPTNIVERADASNGKFLSAAADTTEHNYFTFNLDLRINCQILMSVSYSQPDGWNDNKIDMRDSYHFLIDENKRIGLAHDYFLYPRNDITQWSRITYDKFTLPNGRHSIRVSVLKKTGLGNPNIDFLSFKVTEIADIVVDDVDKPENDFHTNLQYAYLMDKLENINLYAKGVEEKSIPEGIVIECDSIEYDDNQNFSNPSSAVCDSKTKKCHIYNLLLGQNLFWRKSKKSDVFHIKVTNQTPRNLFIEGATNVRDIGGYKSSLFESGTIRQGLYFRGSNINRITKNGKKELLRLGVKTEIDLRDDYLCKGPYVDGIEYHAIPIPSCTEEIRFEEFNDEYKKIFSLISFADKRPVYLHCLVGADRTGIVTFILLVVCGVSYEDIVRDYLFTNFSTCGERNLDSEFNNWWKKLDLYDGEIKPEKAKNWLISKGITEEMVEHIREIFIEVYTK